MGQIIIRKRLPSEVQTPPIGKSTLFIDSSDGLLKKKESTGAIIIIGTSSAAGIKYVWNSQVEQDAVSGQSIGERGVRNDVIRRPVYEWDGGVWVRKFDLDGDAYKVPYENSLYPALTNTGSAIDLLLYKAITVAMTGGGVYERGQTVNSVNLSWTLNKTPVSQVIDNGIGNVLPGITVYNITSAGLTTNTTYTITVSDGVNTADASITIEFVNKLYWGVGIANQLGDSFILNLGNSILSTTRQRTISVNADINSKIYFVSPVALGMPVISINGFVGGFKITSVNHTNLYGHTEPYYVCESEQYGLGVTTVKID